MRVRVASASLLGVLMMTTGWAASGENPQAQEAREFFKQVASQTHNSLIASLAEENIKKLQGNSRFIRKVTVPLMVQPDASLAVPVLINSKIMGTFLVDTGSSYTVITPAMASKLGIQITPETPHTNLITANGTIEAPVVTLRHVSVGGIRVAEMKAIVQPLGSGDDLLLGGLLGMNFFKGMEFTLRDDQLIIGVETEQDF